MDWPRVSRRTDSGLEQTGVYTDLDTLTRLKYHATGYSLKPGQPVHSILAGRHASRLRGRGLDFDEIRSYRPGDDVRAMDWKATARLRQPHIRVYTEERDRPCVLVVDQRQSMFFGSRLMMKSVAAAEVAALGLWRVIDQGDRAGMVVFGDQGVQVIGPSPGRGLALRGLRALNTFNHQLSADPKATPAPAMLNTALQRAARLVHHDALFVLVSDFNGADATTRQLMMQVAAHNDTLAVHVADPLEQRLPQAGRLTFQKGEKQLEVDTTTRRIRAGHEERFSSVVARAQGFLRRLGAPLITIDTASPVVDQIRQQIGIAARSKR